MVASRLVGENIMSSKQEIENIFGNLENTVATHLDIRQHGLDIFKMMTKNENKWGVLIGTTIQALVRMITDQKGAEKVLNELLAKTIELRNKNVEDASRLFGDKMAQAYSIGFAEGSYDCMEHNIKLFREKIDAGFLADPNGNLKTLLNVMEKVAQDQYNKAFKDGTLTFFAANKPSDSSKTK